MSSRGYPRAGAVRRGLAIGPVRLRPAALPRSYRI